MVNTHPNHGVHSTTDEQISTGWVYAQVGDWRLRVRAEYLQECKTTPVSIPNSNLPYERDWVQGQGRETGIRQRIGRALTRETTRDVILLKRHRNRVAQWTRVQLTGTPGRHAFTTTSDEPVATQLLQPPMDASINFVLVNLGLVMAYAFLDCFACLLKSRIPVARIELRFGRVWYLA